jgi:hypothetical protein
MGMTFKEYGEILRANNGKIEIWNEIDVLKGEDTQVNVDVRFTHTYEEVKDDYTFILHTFSCILNNVCDAEAVKKMIVINKTLPERYMQDYIQAGILALLKGETDYHIYITMEILRGNVILKIGHGNNANEESLEGNITELITYVSFYSITQQYAS